MITRRSLLRGLFAMPAVVAYGNIMPVHSIERLLAPPSRDTVIYVHPRMFDDLLGYIEHYNSAIVEVTGITEKMLGAKIDDPAEFHRRMIDPWGNGDLRAVIKDGVLGIDWPAEGVRIERSLMIPMSVTAPLADRLLLPRKHSMGEVGEFSGTRLVK